MKFVAPEEGSRAPLQIHGRGGDSVFGLTTTSSVLEYTRPQLSNKVQMYDLGEWWGLRGTRSMRRLGRSHGIFNNMIDT